MSLVRSWLGRVALVTSVLFAAAAVFWLTAPTPIKQTIVFEALAQSGCVPNPNLTGPPNFVNGCPLPAAALNFLLGSSYTFFVVQAYGAKGDGTTNDTAAVNAALGACSTAKGGFIYFPPTGHSYRLTTAPSSVPNGCQIRGMGGFNVPGLYDNVEADWTASGTWFRCEDVVNTCVSLAGTGSSIDGVNFWYTQPTPSSTTCGSPPCTYIAGWTPTTYPYTITIPFANNVGNWIENIAIVNGYDCIDVEGTGNGIALMRSHIDHVIINCFDRDIKMNSIDNTLSLFDVREDPIWFQGSLQVLNYIEGTAGHGIGWDVNYVANLQASHIEFFERRIAILLTDGQAINGFGSLAFAGANWQVNGISFNEVCQAMVVASNTTHFAGGSPGNGVGSNEIQNIIAAADTNTSKSSPQQCAAGKAMFDFSSDNVGVHLDNLNVGFADTIVKIGAGTSGFLRVTNPRSQQYSAFTTGQAAFVVAANATPDIHGDFLAVVPAASSPGPLLSGVAIGPFGMMGEGQIGANVQQTAILSFGTFPASPAIGTPINRRWALRKDIVNESGSNVGSDLNLDRYNDAGTFIDTPLKITRSTGNINLNDQFFLAQTTVTGLASAPYSACTGGADIGAMVLVTDQTAAETFGSTVSAGGGSVRVVAVCNGTNWIQH